MSFESCSDRRRIAAALLLIVPGVFQPVHINGRDYVDGGVVSPIPVNVARRLGADIVIAVDISAQPALRAVKDTIDVLVQTFIIMGSAIAGLIGAQAHEIIAADSTSINIFKMNKIAQNCIKM